MNKNEKFLYIAKSTIKWQVYYSHWYQLFGEVESTVIILKKFIVCSNNEKMGSHT